MALESLPIATDESSFACAPEPEQLENFHRQLMILIQMHWHYALSALADSPIATVSAAVSL